MRIDKALAKLKFTLAKIVDDYCEGTDGMDRVHIYDAPQTGVSKLPLVYYRASGLNIPDTMTGAFTLNTVTVRIGVITDGWTHLHNLAETIVLRVVGSGLGRLQDVTQVGEFVVYDSKGRVEFPTAELPCEAVFSGTLNL